MSHLSQVHLIAAAARIFTPSCAISPPSTALVCLAATSSGTAELIAEHPRTKMAAPTVCWERDGMDGQHLPVSKFSNKAFAVAASGRELGDFGTERFFSGCFGAMNWRSLHVASFIHACFLGTYGYFSIVSTGLRL